MTRRPDPRRLARLRLLAAAAAAAAVVVTALRFALVLPATVPPPPPVPPPTATAAARFALDIAAWDVPLWQRLRDAPPPPPPPPPPLTVKLLAVMRSGDGAVALIDAGPEGLRRVRAGEAIQGRRVLRVEAGGIVIESDGQEQRLELRR